MHTSLNGAVRSRSWCPHRFRLCVRPYQIRPRMHQNQVARLRRDRYSENNYCVSYTRPVDP